MKVLQSRLWFSWIFIAMGILFLAKPGEGEMVAKMPQVMDPFYLTMADGRIYIVENSCTAHLYTIGLNEVTFIKDFGREGQGPGEFGFMYRIRVLDDHLDISGNNKLARFSLDGEYIDEVKVPVGMFKGGIYQVGENYLAGDFQFSAIESTRTIRLYDKDFKLIREIGSMKEAYGLEKLNLVTEVFSSRVAGDQIFVIASGKESIVTVYDRNGVREKEIRLPLEPIKITAALKEAVIKPLKEDPEMKARWSMVEKRIYFPDKTPGLDYFDIVDGKFIARTYKYRQNSVEFVVFDQQGRDLQRMFLPHTGRLSNGILFCFYQGRYYYLQENAEDYSWELHSEKIW
ncbi:MAG: 6-bladed beta-propeller [Candidatus Aminicenantes bacterium]|nr:6-bladed beta-propeller [Candidatus Aminicenantes bacterium]